MWFRGSPTAAWIELTNQGGSGSGGPVSWNEILDKPAVPFSIPNGGTGVADELIRNNNRQTASTITLAANQRFIYLGLDGGRPTTAPCCDLSSTANTNIFYNSGNYRWKAGTPFIFFLENNTSWSTSRTNSNSAWSNPPPSLPFIKWIGPKTILNQSNSGVLEENWTFTLEYNNNSGTYRGQYKIYTYVYLGMSSFTAISGGVNVSSSRYFPMFYHLCGE